VVENTKILIICEGVTDKGFLNKYRNHLKIKSHLVDVMSMGGKSPLLKNENYKTIKQQVDANLYVKVIFVLDADFEAKDKKYGGYVNSEKWIKKLINELNFQHIAEYYIMCDPKTRDGNLEHFILSTLDEAEVKCVQSFLECTKEMDTHDNKKIVFQLYNDIFKKTPDNFEHDNFNALNSLITNLEVP